ncbi:hypothetical protein BH10ACT2_BH10ACT2_10640 [soil metagenome]
MVAMTETVTKHVDPAYQQFRKLIQPGPLLEVKGARLKWYDVALADQPVPAEIGTMARTYVAAEGEADRLTFDGDRGFVVLHRCGESFYFLLVSTWRGSNELWESVYAKPDAAAADFSVWPREGRHVPTFCVWELGAVWHEQQAWVRFLRSVRDEAAMAEYMQDQISGPVG